MTIHDQGVKRFMLQPLRVEGKKNLLYTVKPRLTATSVILSPRYYGYFSSWPPVKNRHTIFCEKNPP